MEEELLALAPSDNAPWFHRVQLSDGRLSLYWRTASGTDRLRTFSQEETQTLLKFLNDHSIEILKD